MRTSNRPLAVAALTGAVLTACALAQPAAAQSAYDYNGNAVYPAPSYATSRPLTVQRHYYAPRPSYDPYRGPQAIVTAPLAAAGTLVALPFRIINGVFPPDAQDPRVIVGAPVYAAGQVAQVPIRAAQAPFGGWNYVAE